MLLRAIQGILDILFHSPDEEILTYELASQGSGRGGASQKASLPAVQAGRITALDDIPDFGLERLSYRQLIALRRDMNAFADFCQALSRGLDGYAKYHTQGDVDSAQHVLREEVEPVALKIAEYRPTLELPVATSAVQQFIYGAIPVGAGALSGSLATGLSAAAAVGASHLIWGYARTWRRRHTGKVGKSMIDLPEE